MLAPRFLARARAAPQPAVSIRGAGAQLGGLFGASRSKPLAEGSAFHLGAPFPRAREGGASASGVSIRRRRRAAMGTVRREPIETAGRGVAVAGVRSGISGWVIGLLIRGRAGAERRAANPGRRVLADVEARRRFLFGTWRSRWRSSSATAARNSWPEGSLRMCSHSVGFWNRPSATAP